MGGSDHLSGIERLPEAALAFMAGALVLLASLLNLLLFNRYPLLTAEVGLLVLMIIAAAAIMVPIYAGQRWLGKAVLAGLLAFLAVDLNTDSVWAALVLGLAGAIASWKMGAGLLRFLSLIAAVAIVTSALGLTERAVAVSVTQGADSQSAAPAFQSGAQADPPLIVHLILDEMGGLAGLRAMDSGSSKLAEDVQSTMLKAGFTVDSLAFTPWANTIRSVPAALNYGKPAEISGDVDDGGSIGKVEMLQDLHERGYELKLWQTSYLDFCAANAFDECVTSNVNHLRILRQTRLPTADRAIIIGSNLVAQSRLGHFVSDGLDAVLASTGLTGTNVNFPPALMHRRYVSTLHGEKTLRQLAMELRNARPGTAYIAHILLPHYPFAYNSDCSLRDFDTWEAPWRRRAIQNRWHRYDQQYRCALRRVIEIASAVDSSAAGGNAVLIVHGDHGPRIRDRTLEDDPTIERTILSAMFAVRRSGEKGSIFNRQCPIGSLLQATVQNEKSPRSCDRRYYLERGPGFAAVPISDWSNSAVSKRP